MSVLKRRGIRHEESDNPDFFLACVRQFVKLARTMSRDDKARHSISLVNMIQCDAEAYKEWAQTPAVNGWAAVKAYLADSPIFLTAELSFPYDQGRRQQLVALKHSEDHSNYRLVANAVAVTSNAIADTNKLRAILDLPTEPQLAHVVEHLLILAKGNTVQLLSKSRADPLFTLVLEDIEKAYGCIVNGVHAFLRASNTQDPVYVSITKRLAREAWVLTPDHAFVTANELGFNMPSEASSSKSL